MAPKAKTKTARSKSLIPAADGKKLVIVESPAKARTVGQILEENMWLWRHRDT